jgi:hypothetical protein
LNLYEDRLTAACSLDVEDLDDDLRGVYSVRDDLWLAVDLELAVTADVYLVPGAAAHNV